MVDWWPSERVPQGGILHPAKVQDYSPETHKLLKDLMQESKMTMQQRNRVNYFLRNGEPFPSNSANTKITTRRGVNQIKISHDAVSRLRSRETIINSGAYERDKFIRLQPFRNREQDKLKLQEVMEFGKIEKKSLEKNKSKIEIQKTRFEQLKEEIQERMDWLAEMEQLGQGKKYREVINQQVAEKLKEMQELKINK